MYPGKLVFSQIMEHLPLHVFHQCVERYRGNFKVKDFTCLDHYLCMAFAQLTYRESLRDIEACLRAQKSKLYHMGIRSSISRNAIANANKIRDWRIYADFAYSLIQTARKLYAGDSLALDLDNTVYALDATTINLCLSMFPWAEFRTTKAAVKLHTLLDLRGNIPSFIYISDGRLHEVNTLDLVPLEPGAFYVMDRGYLDFTAVVPFPPFPGLLCHSCKVEPEIPARLFRTNGSFNGNHVRSDDSAYRRQFGEALPGKAPQGEVLRCRKRQNARFSDQ